MKKLIILPILLALASVLAYVNIDTPTGYDNVQIVEGDPYTLPEIDAIEPVYAKDAEDRDIIVGTEPVPVMFAFENGDPIDNTTLFDPGVYNVTAAVMATDETIYLPIQIVVWPEKRVMPIPNLTIQHNFQFFTLSWDTVDNGTYTLYANGNEIATYQSDGTPMSYTQPLNQHTVLFHVTVKDSYDVTKDPRFAELFN